MAECPWCHAQVQDARAAGPCPRCGKHARDLRTTDPPDAAPPKGPPPDAASKPASNVEPKPALEVPDLVVPKPAPSRPGPARAPAKSPPPSVDKGHPGGLDLQIDLGAVSVTTLPSKPHAPAPPPSTNTDPFEDELGAGPSLELDTGGGSLPPRLAERGVGASSGPAPMPPAIPPPTSAAPVPAASQRALAPAAEPATPKPAVDPFEAKALADFGPPPAAIWLTPLYAYRVLVRRSELQRLLAQKRTEAEASARRAEDGWVAFGERMRTVLERGGGRGLEHVLAAEQVLRGRDSALAGAMDTHHAELAGIDARLGVVEGELARAREQERSMVALREAAEEDRGRADAKLKRLDIETRNAGAPQVRAAERAALAAELAGKQAKLADASAKLAAAQQATRAVQASVDTVRSERKAAEDRFARQVGTRSDGVEDARRALRAALVALGRSMTQDASATELGGARDEAARLDEQAEAAAKQLALHEAATSSFDGGKVMLGVGVVVVGLLLLLILVLFPFIYRAVVS